MILDLNNDQEGESKTKYQVNSSQAGRATCCYRYGPENLVHTYDIPGVQ